MNKVLFGLFRAVFLKYTSSKRMSKNIPINSTKPEILQQCPAIKKESRATRNSQSMTTRK